MSYTQKALIRTGNCDMFGRWKPSAILEAMQEVAIAHCETLGLGRSVTDSMGIVWVLSRCRVEFTRLPVNRESVTVETFAMPTRHLFYPRGHVFRDSEGQLIGSAQGLWLLMDIHQRKVVDNPVVRQHLPFEDLTVPAGMPASVRAPDKIPEEGLVVPQFTEYDINGHVNNARYLDWCSNALGIETLREHEVIGFDVNYDSELLPGEIVQTTLYREDSTFTFCGLVAGKRRFGISGRLKRTTQ